MYCPNCGKKAEDRTLFGDECGTPLNPEQENEQDLNNSYTDENVSETGNPTFLHTKVGKAVIAAIAICLAGAATITGVAQYNTNQPELLLDTEEDLKESAYEDILYDVDDLSEDQQAMFGPLGAVINHYKDVSSDKDIQHAWTTTEDDWASLACLFTDYAYLYDDNSEKLSTDSNNSIVVSENFLREGASALYADYNGILSDAPAASIDGVKISETEDAYYVFNSNGSHEDILNPVIYTWTGHADGTETLIVEAYSNQDELEACYLVDLVKNSYTEDCEDPVFVYSISSLSQLNEDSLYDEDDYWEDEDSWDMEDEEVIVGDDDFGDAEDEESILESDDYWDTDDEESDSEYNDSWDMEDEELFSDYNDSWDKEDEYILPESDIRYYSKEDLAVYDQSQLRLARNEIYARHGRIFDSPDLQEYFESQSWYQGTIRPNDFSENVLNKYEKANISTIQSLETDTQTAIISEPETTESKTSDPENTEPADSITITGSDDIDDSAFEKSWSLIQSYELSENGKDARDSINSKYFCTSLSFTIYGSTLIDRGSYFEVQAVFNKPITVPQNMKVGDQYTAVVDELKGTTAMLIGAEDIDGNFCLFEEGAEGEQVYGWYGDFNSQSGMTELTGDDGHRLEAPFYEGMLRIRKDAVTGDFINLDTAYRTVTVSDLDECYKGQDSRWFNYTGFDQDGYVTELVYLGG